MVVLSADLTPDRRLQATGGQARSLYAEMARNVSTRPKLDGGAMGSIVERFASRAVRTAERNGREPGAVIREKLADLQELTGGYDFAEVIARYWEGFDTGNEELCSAALRWLRAEYSTKTDARKALGVRTIINGRQHLRPTKAACVICARSRLPGVARVARRVGQPLQADLFPSQEGEL